MRKLWAILVLGLSLAALYAGCSTRVDVGKSAQGVSDAVNASTNPAPAFRVRQEEGKWWLISPVEKKFFSIGVCVVSRGSSKEEFDAENPSYASWEHYGSPQK